ncbi:MAG: GNAT family N-acetyltransferase [Lactococcus chungangensis]|jgi:ribosomal-protein-alanine N-acetyltransferase|nr:GNAT family N-acetyltransferase [Lactococcus chungangensis]
MTLSTDKIMDETVEILSLAKTRTLDLERVVLRPLTQADLMDYHELTSDDAALKYDYPAHQTIEESEEMLVKWHLSIPFGKYGVYHKRMLKSLGV